MSTPNPFLTTDRDVLLSASSCSLIADLLAERISGNARAYDAAPALPDDPAVLLRAEQVAEIFAISRDAVFDLARRSGDPLPSRKIGRARRFLRSEVDEWSARQR